MQVVDPLPADINDLPTLITTLNQRFDAINQDFDGLTSSGKSVIQDPTSAFNTATEGNAFSFSNPDVNVYDFLDPLFQALRQNQILVNQAQVLNNSIGPLALQVDSVTARVIQAGAVTADKINVNELSAISANLGTITAGNMTIDTSGFIRGGATGYNAGTGFWLGYDLTAYKFFVGASAGQKMLWDGTDLSITGSITATTGNIGGWTINSTNITKNNLFLDASIPAIRAGQSGYNSGTGWFLGFSGSTPVASFGNPAGAFMTWSGTTLTIGGSAIINVGTGVNNVQISSTDFVIGTQGNTGQTYSLLDGTGLRVLSDGTPFARIQNVVNGSSPSWMGVITTYFGTAGGGSTVGVEIAAGSASSITFNADTSAVLVYGGSGLLSMPGSLTVSNTINVATIAASTVNTTDLNSTGTISVQGIINTPNNSSIDLNGATGLQISCSRTPSAGGLVGYLNMRATDGSTLNIPFYS